MTRRRPNLSRRRFCLVGIVLLLFTASQLAHADESDGVADPLGAAIAAGQLPGQAPTSDPERLEWLFEQVGEGFSIAETARFRVIHNMNDVEVTPFLHRIEATADSVARFLRINGIEQDMPSEKMDILYFATREEFLDFARRQQQDVRYASGYYYPFDNYAVFYNAASRPDVQMLDRQLDRARYQLQNLRTGSTARRKMEVDIRRLVGRRDSLVEEINLYVVQHEVAHQVLFNAGVHVRNALNPRWIVEGLAMLFETPPSAFGAGIAATNQRRLHAFRQLANPEKPGAATEDDILAAIRRRRLVPLKKLVSNGELFSLSGDRQQAAYAEAWSLVYFLQRRERESLAKYLEILSKREPLRKYSPEEELDDFESAFGEIDDVFERRWSRYILHLRYDPPKQN